MAEFFSPKGKRVSAESNKDKFSISLAIPGRRISAEVVPPNCSCWGALVFVGLIRWLEKPPDLLATQTHDPKMKEVPASIAGKPKANDAIELF